MKILFCCLIYLCCLLNVHADEDFIAEQRASFDTMSPEKIQLKRNEILKMADATINLAGKGMGVSKAYSLVPGISLYQLNDTGIVLQANWGATEFLNDPQLNQ